jgi:hypothetical protein
MGNGSTIRPGDVQRMSAGTGVLHSEMNPSKDHPVHFFQIWIVPEQRGIKPGYEQKTFPLSSGLRLVASRDGRDDSVSLHQDVSLYRGRVDAPVTHAFAAGRHGWLQVARGEVSVNRVALAAGDGAAISDEREVTLAGNGEVLLFDLN